MTVTCVYIFFKCTQNSGTVVNKSAPNHDLRYNNIKRGNGSIPYIYTYKQQCVIYIRDGSAAAVVVRKRRWAPKRRFSDMFGDTNLVKKNTARQMYPITNRYWKNHNCPVPRHPVTIVNRVLNTDIIIYKNVTATDH